MFRSRLSGALRGLLARRGWVIESRRRVETRDRQIAALFRRAAAAATAPSHDPSAPPVEAVVFSKDRPLQLDALLRSYFDCVADAAPVRVLYAAGSQRAADGYAALARRFADRPLAFMREGSFRDDLLALLAQIRAPRLLPLVDDIVFTHPTRLADFAGLDLADHVPSLRHGRNLRRSYAGRAIQPLPPLEDIPGSPGLVRWRWSEGRLDWAYPLSVDGHIFATHEARILAEISPFHSPNTLEAAWQALLPAFRDRFGVAYAQSRLVNLPLNRVQHDYRNRHGQVDAQELLERWEAGYEIDVASLRGSLNDSVHQELPFAFRRR